MRYVRLRANAILQCEWLLTGIGDSVRDLAEAIAITVFSGEAKRKRLVALLEKKKGGNDKNAGSGFRTRLVSKQ